MRASQTQQPHSPIIPMASRTEMGGSLFPVHFPNATKTTGTLKINKVTA
jgi:hypothetical protein